MLKDRSEYIEDVAKEPDDNEREGEAICRGAPEVFYDLRRKDDHPAGY